MIRKSNEDQYKQVARGFMNPAKLKVVKEVITRFYVQLDDWIQAGPFDSREEADTALKEIKGNKL